MFVILQKYDFSSKSQHIASKSPIIGRCLWYCKSTIFQANHNYNGVKVARVSDVCDTAKVRFFKQITTVMPPLIIWQTDVCDTAKVRFFKQITTGTQVGLNISQMFVILQKYDFSSKSQQDSATVFTFGRCLWYCKSTIFQANHNYFSWMG